MTDLLSREESIEGVDEVCEVCAHSIGPILLQCGCPQSEFYRGPVHPLGFCEWFKARQAAGEKLGKV